MKPWHLKSFLRLYFLYLFDLFDFNSRVFCRIDTMDRSQNSEVSWLSLNASGTLRDKAFAGQCKRYIVPYILYSNSEKWISDQGVCLIEAESSRRTDAIHGPNEDGSYDYGLFQINSRYWCNTGATPGNVCNLRCDGR